MKLFTQHPKENHQTYLEHFKFALRFSTKLIIAGIAVFIHSIFPFLLVDYGSCIVKELNKELEEKHLKCQKLKSQLQ